MIIDEIKQLKENCEIIAENIIDWFEDNDYVMMEKHVTELLDSVVSVNLFLLRNKKQRDIFKK